MNNMQNNQDTRKNKAEAQIKSREKARRSAMVKRKRHTAIFYICLLLFVVISITAVLIFQNPLKEWLVDYESSLSKYEVERIFKEYFEKPDAYTLVQMSSNKPEYNAPDTEMDAIESFAEKIKGRAITYGYVAGSERKTVNVKADGVKFAQFSIKEKAEKSKFGLTYYELDKIKLYYDKPDSYAKIKLPERYTLYIGGDAADENYLIQSGIKEDERSSVPDGAYLFTYKVYEIKGLYKLPEFLVKDENLNEVKLSFDEEEKLYFCKYEYSESLKQQYSEYVLNAMQKYAVYMQDDARFKTISGYFDPDSVLYKNIYDNPGSFVWEHDGYGFDNSETSEFFAYGDDVFSCRVAFDHILKKSGRENYVDRCDFTIYLHKVDNEFKIYYMESH